MRKCTLANNVMYPRSHATAQKELQNSDAGMARSEIQNKTKYIHVRTLITLILIKLVQVWGEPLTTAPGHKYPLRGRYRLLGCQV